MRAGSLDTTVKFTRLHIAGTTPAGEMIRQWRSFATVRAAVMSDLAPGEVKLRLRWIDDLQPDDRATLNGDTYIVTATQQIGRRRELEVTLGEVKP